MSVVFNERLKIGDLVKIGDSTFNIDFDRLTAAGFDSRTIEEFERRIKEE